MNAIANVVDWHKYVYAILGVVGLIATGIIAQPQVVPPALYGIVGWMPFVLLLDGSIGAFLPRIQTATGPGAPAILSPPAKDAGGTIQGHPVQLVDGHALPPNAFTASVLSPTTTNAANVPATGTRPRDPQP